MKNKKSPNFFDLNTFYDHFHSHHANPSFCHQSEGYLYLVDYKIEIKFFSNQRFNHFLNISKKWCPYIKIIYLDHRVISAAFNFIEDTILSIILRHSQ